MKPSLFKLAGWIQFRERRANESRGKCLFANHRSVRNSLAIGSFEQDQTECNEFVNQAAYRCQLERGEEATVSTVCTCNFAEAFEYEWVRSPHQVLSLSLSPSLHFFSSLLYSSLSALHPVASFPAPHASLLRPSPATSTLSLFFSRNSSTLCLSFYVLLSLSFALESNREQLGSSIGGRFSVRVPRFFRSVSSRELHARVLSQGLDSASGGLVAWINGINREQKEEEEQEEEEEAEEASHRRIPAGRGTVIRHDAPSMHTVSPNGSIYIVFLFREYAVVSRSWRTQRPTVVGSIFSFTALADRSAVTECTYVYVMMAICDQRISFSEHFTKTTHPTFRSLVSPLIYSKNSGFKVLEKFLFVVVISKGKVYKLLKKKKIKNRKI